MCFRRTGFPPVLSLLVPAYALAGAPPFLVGTASPRPATLSYHLQKQIRQAHIMTLQKSASGSDFGSVGFIERKNAIYLEFPKSLQRFVDQRIVGIKWELLKN